MGKAIEHAQSSVKKYGGRMEAFLPIHELLDGSRTVFGDVRHRALTHHIYFIQHIPKILGYDTVTVRKNGKRVKISVLQIAEDHLREDFGGMIPSASDFLQAIVFQDWMNGKNPQEIPPSKRRDESKTEVVFQRRPFMGKID
jgi:hypothetical protein